MAKEKKRIFSGIQPSGNLTIGNYLGALKNFPTFQDEYDAIYCVVDLHSITVRQDPVELKKRSHSLLALYLACGLDPEKATLFVQSHVPGHTQLSWVLGCFTYMGELNRMTQFKDKSAKHADNINAGLYTYPVLMAADILLYNTDVVPIGQDQKQHLELARNIAERFNGIYGPTFKVPEPFIGKNGAKIMALQNPEKKMSKSDDNVNNFVLITEDPDVIIKKFKKAVTDSETEIRFDPESKPGVSNLLSIYAAVKSISIEEAVNNFAGSRYGEFKIAVGESVRDELAPVRARYEEFIKDEEYLERVLSRGAEKAEAIAAPMVKDVFEKVGFIVK